MWHRTKTYSKYKTVQPANATSADVEGKNSNKNGGESIYICFMTAKRIKEIKR